MLTASQMAAASAASFLPRLPLIRYGATNLGAISLTVWRKRLNCRAQLWAPEQASRPIRQGGRVAGWQVGDDFQQLAANYLGLDKNRLATLVNTMQSEYILGEIDAYGDNIHGLPLSNE